LAAFKDASAKAEASMANATGGMAAGLNIPGFNL
jgi:DNA-binding protein YbaB